MVYKVGFSDNKKNLPSIELRDKAYGIRLRGIKKHSNRTPQEIVFKT